MAQPLRKKDYKLMRTIFGSSKSGRATIRWVDLVKCFSRLGFNITTSSSTGSVHKFTPPSTNWAFNPVPFCEHRPHQPKFRSDEVVLLRRKLNEIYGWDLNSFTIA